MASKQVQFPLTFGRRGALLEQNKVLHSSAINPNMCSFCLNSVLWPDKKVESLHKHNIDSWSFFLHSQQCECNTLCHRVCSTCFPISTKSQKKDVLPGLWDIQNACRCRICLQHASVCTCPKRKCHVFDCGKRTDRPIPSNLRKFFENDDDDDDENLEIFRSFCDEHLSVCRKHKKLFDVFDPMGCPVCYSNDIAGNYETSNKEKEDIYLLEDINDPEQMLLKPYISSYLSNTNGKCRACAQTTERDVCQNFKNAFDNKKVGWEKLKFNKAVHRCWCDKHLGLCQTHNMLFEKEIGKCDFCLASNK